MMVFQPEMFSGFPMEFTPHLMRGGNDRDSALAVFFEEFLSR